MIGPPRPTVVKPREETVPLIVAFLPAKIVDRAGLTVGVGGDGRARFHEDVALGVVAQVIVSSALTVTLPTVMRMSPPWPVSPAPASCGWK